MNESKLNIATLSDYIVLRNLKLIEENREVHTYYPHINCMNLEFITFLCCLELDIDLTSMQDFYIKTFNKNSKILHSRIVNNRYNLNGELGIIEIPSEEAWWIPFDAPKTIYNIEDYPLIYNKLNYFIDTILSYRLKSNVDYHLTRNKFISEIDENWLPPKNSDDINELKKLFSRLRDKFGIINIKQEVNKMTEYILTELTLADKDNGFIESLIGKEGYFADDLAELKFQIQHKNIHKLLNIYKQYPKCFTFDDRYAFRYFVDKNSALKVKF